MQVKYIWPKCPVGYLDEEFSWKCEPKNSFWVLASEKEANKFIVPLMNQHEFSYWNSFLLPKNILKNNYDIYLRDVDGNSGFLITYDLSRVQFMDSIYPISGMWNGRSPFKKFDKIISSLEDLKQLL